MANSEPRVQVLVSFSPYFPKMKIDLPFSASACRTSKIISNLSWFSALLSCFTSCSATFVLLRASLAESVYMIKSGL